MVETSVIGEIRGLTTESGMPRRWPLRDRPMRLPG